MFLFFYIFSKLLLSCVLRSEQVWPASKSVRENKWVLKCMDWFCQEGLWDLHGLSGGVSSDACLTWWVVGRDNSSIRRRPPSLKVTCFTILIWTLQLTTLQHVWVYSSMTYKAMRATFSRWLFWLQLQFFWKFSRVSQKRLECFVVLVARTCQQEYMRTSGSAIGSAVGVAHVYEAVCPLSGNKTSEMTITCVHVF